MHVGEISGLLHLTNLLLVLVGESKPRGVLDRLSIVVHDLEKAITTDLNGGAADRRASIRLEILAESILKECECVLFISVVNYVVWRVVLTIT